MRFRWLATLALAACTPADKPDPTDTSVPADTDTDTDTDSDTDTDTDTAAESGRWVSAYYVGYQRDLLPADEIDFTAITHLVVGRVTPNADGSLDTHFDIDDVAGPAMARDLAERTHAAGRTALLMVGGAGEHEGFAAAAADGMRATFVASLLSTMDDLGYDGLDLDWEPVYAEDEAPLAALVADLRAARPGIVLTMPVGWVSMNFPDVPTVYAEIADDLDQINLMTYSMADGWPGWLAWHSSALDAAAGQTPSSVAVSVTAYLDAGVPAAKLGVGIGYYGSCWDTVTAPGQDPAGGLIVAGDNTMSYANIVTRYHTDAAYRYDEDADAPYLSDVSGLGDLGCTFVSYEDERSIAAKGAYVAEMGLGGAILWTVNQGHLADAPAGEKDPLLAATKAAFLE